MRVRVCVCAPHFAEVSKMAQDAPGATTRAGAKEHKHRSDHHKSTRAGARPQERECDQSERTSAGTRARAYKKKLQKTIAN